MSLPVTPPWSAWSPVPVTTLLVASAFALIVAALNSVNSYSQPFVSSITASVAVRARLVARLVGDRDRLTGVRDVHGRGRGRRGGLVDRHRPVLVIVPKTVALTRGQLAQPRTAVRVNRKTRKRRIQKRRRRPKTRDRRTRHRRRRRTSGLGGGRAWCPLGHHAEHDQRRAGPHGVFVGRRDRCL